MPIHVRQYLGRSAIRNSDQRLVPAIIACNFSVCFLLFGVFMTISGVIFRSVAASSSSSSSSISGSGRDPSSIAVTVGTVILSIGSILAGIGLVLMIFAWISFKRYETMRRNELHNNPSSLHNFNYETSFTTNVPQNNHYPFQPQHNLYPRQADGYQPQQLQPPPQLVIPDPNEPPPSYSVQPSERFTNQPKYS